MTRKLPTGNGGIKQTEALLETLEAGLCEAQGVAAMCECRGRSGKAQHALTLVFTLSMAKAIQQTEALLAYMRHEDTTK